MKLSQFWQRHLPTAAAENVSDMQGWRENILNAMLVVFMILGSIATLINVPTAIERQAWLMAVLFVAAYVFLLIVTFVRQLSFNFRAGTLVTMVYLLGIVVFQSDGLIGSGRIWLFAFSVIAVSLFGRSGSIASFIVNIITLAAFNYLVFAERLVFASQPFQAWRLTTSTFIMLNAVVTFSLAAFFRGFEANLRQMQEMTISLEQRIVDRTRALETSIAVGRQLSTILDPNELVTEVVTQVQAAFNYYHVHIYLLDESHQNLILTGGTGEAARVMLANDHKIPIGKGLVGRAAASHDITLVPDVSVEPDWLPNPLLPDTKAEIAVPIELSNEVFGVLDVQHNVIDGLSNDDARLLQSVASQVAIALRNAQLFAETRRQANREARINVIGQEIQKASDIETVLKTAVRELGQALNAPRVTVMLDQQTLRKNSEFNREGI